MPFDPALPATNSPISSAELRNQFTALNDLVNDRPTTSQMQDYVEEVAAAQTRAVDLLPPGFTVSDPPTQAEVQAIADKLNELISALNAH